MEKMFHRWNAMDGWKNKISSVIKGPGWSPGSPWTGYIDQIPDVSISCCLLNFDFRLINFKQVTSREKHSYAVKPFIWSVYIFSHFFIALSIYESVGFFRNVT